MPARDIIRAAVASTFVEGNDLSEWLDAARKKVGIPDRVKPWLKAQANESLVHEKIHINPSIAQIKSLADRSKEGQLRDAHMASGEMRVADASRFEHDEMKGGEEAKSLGFIDKPNVFSNRPITYGYFNVDRAGGKDYAKIALHPYFEKHGFRHANELLYGGEPPVRETIKLTEWA